MQGGVFGSLMCTTSMDSLAKEVYSRPEVLYKYKGVADIPPLLMVDDILTISKCSPTESALNATVNAFINRLKSKESPQTFVPKILASWYPEWANCKGFLEPKSVN